MAVEINGSTVGECYRDALFKMRVHGRDEDTRAGRVLTIEEPVVMTLRNPESRVLRDPARNANPFFHVMEVVWMMAGASSVNWISQFNHRMGEFSNDGKINGAYGMRWAQHNQINKTIKKLENKSTRQAVISMWNPMYDNIAGMNDYPCNTHIYFRTVRGQLNMTVCNRSNDLIWGMLGANVVHMTYLHELISCATGIPLGKYQVMTNNLHIYERHWPLLDTASSVNPHDEDFGCGPPILGADDGEDFTDFAEECEEFMHTDGQKRYDSVWLNTVAEPMRQAYLERSQAEWWIPKIMDPAWRKAGMEWLSRRSVSTGLQGQSVGTIQNA